MAASTDAIRYTLRGFLDKQVAPDLFLSGKGGLSHTPVLDYRSYTDDRENGDIHMILHQFSTRQRLALANGHAENHVMSVGGLWGFTQDEPDLGELFKTMDTWLLNIKGDTSATMPAEKVLNGKPPGLSDSCWEYNEESRRRVDEPLSFSSAGLCGELYPAFLTPRHVAGAPLANDIVSCTLKPLDQSDYNVQFSDSEWLLLSQIFRDGVCDWSRPDRHGASYQGTWLSFGPSPVNRIQ